MDGGKASTAPARTTPTRTTTTGAGSLPQVRASTTRARTGAATGMPPHGRWPVVRRGARAPRRPSGGPPTPRTRAGGRAGSGRRSISIPSIIRVGSKTRTSSGDCSRSSPARQLEPGDLDPLALLRPLRGRVDDRVAVLADRDREAERRAVARADVLLEVVAAARLRVLVGQLLARRPPARAASARAAPRRRRSSSGTCGCRCRRTSRSSPAAARRARPGSPGSTPGARWTNAPAASIPSARAFVKARKSSTVRTKKHGSVRPTMSVRVVVVDVDLDRDRREPRARSRGSRVAAPVRERTVALNGPPRSGPPRQPWRLGGRGERRRDQRPLRVRGPRSVMGPEIALIASTTSTGDGPLIGAGGPGAS